MPDIEIIEERAKLSWIWLSLVVVILDQLSKWWVVNHLGVHEVQRVMPMVNFYLTYNKGAAFSFLHDQPHLAFWLFSSFTFLLSVGLLLWMYRLPKRDLYLSLSFALILGGAVGNLIDRLRYGYVVDFISVHFKGWYFAIFNVADSAITLGAVIIGLHLLLSSRR